MLNSLDNVVSMCLDSNTKKEKKMAVSKQYIEDLVAEMKADAIKREEERAEWLAQVAKMIEDGHCPECLMYYCECY